MYWWWKPIAAVAFLLAIVGVVVLVTMNPSRETVEARIKEKLPPGYVDFEMKDYNQDNGKTTFEVTYKDYGDVVGTTFGVWKGNPSKGITSIGVFRKRSSGGDLDLVSFEFNDEGTMIQKRIRAALPGEGPRLEEISGKLAKACRW